MTQSSRPAASERAPWSSPPQPGVLPIAFGMNVEFLAREITVGAPATQWWINLSTAIVFGLGFATVLTLIVTPAALMAIENVRQARLRWSAALRAHLARA